ncbi:MAG: NCS2 family permease [Candidatus Omnitrophica bacterium]|nr:NCS2 family permease [Candidatus Omnitrophota bacterium]
MFLDRYFKFKENNTSLKREILGGLTTFFTMAYIIVVNPAILEACGIPKSASFTATVLSAFLGTLLMGVYARRPFAIAPYMGENAFIAYTVCKVLGFPWQVALGAVFLGGVLFFFLTLFKLRAWLSKSIPQSLKYSFSAGLGLFLAFIGLNISGFISLGTASAPVKLANLKTPDALLAVFCLLLISLLMIKKVRGAFLLGMLSVTFLGILEGKIKIDSWWSLPPSLAPTFFKFTEFFRYPELVLTWGMFSVVLTVFVMDFVDTMGTLIGVSARAGFLDKDGNLPEIEKPMLVDALATIFSASLGTTTSGTYIESASGVEEGARTGFSSVVCAFLFLLALFFSPLLTLVPPYAYGPVLIIVGSLMIFPVVRIDFSDYTEYIPAFSVIVFSCFTYNLGVGITAGFLFYLLLKLFSGRFRDLNGGRILLGIISLLFFLFYPYK